MYCRVIAATGWTWEYIDEFLTLPRLAAMNRYWAVNPPLHLMVQGYLGYSKPKVRQEDNTEQALEFFTQAFIGAGGIAG